MAILASVNMYVPNSGQLDNIVTLIQDLRQLTEAGIVTDIRIKALEQQKEQLGSLETTVRNLDEWNTDYAKVLASSGYRAEHNNYR